MSRGYLLSLPALLLFAGLLILPLGLTLVLSFNVFDYQVGVKADEWTLAHYLALFSDAYFYEIFWRTFWISALVTLLCVAIGVPEAYILSRMGTPWRSIFLILILTPLLISVVVRAFGWSLLLGADGLVNQVIQALGGRPVKLLYTPFAVIIALVHVMLPFMIIPVWTSLQKLDPSAEQAALSLGASQATVFTRITLPMILPGVTGGWMLAFINSFDEVTMSIFVTSPSTVTLPVRMYMYATESIDPMMAAVSALMVGLTACAMVVLDRVYGLDRVLVGRK